MKKNIYKFLLVISILLFDNLKSQTEAVSFQKNDHLINSETNIHNGIPNINLPLTNIALGSDNINVSVSLSYSAEGISEYKMISDVGKGWSLDYGGAIYKNKNKNEKDYIGDDNSAEISSEIYYYNFFGNTGRFYIGKDEANNQMVAVQLQPSKNRILFTKDSTKPNKITSFTIIDSNGNIYLFDKINIDKFRFGAYALSIHDDVPQNTKLTNSAFLLSKITNNKNQEIVSFEYETTTELVSQFIGTVQENKLKKIHVNNYGDIEFKYKPNNEPHSVKNKGSRDWYVIDKLILRDKSNNIISQYAFLDDGIFLNELRTLDKEDHIIQKYTFDYNRLNGVNLGFDGYGFTNVYDGCSLDEGALLLANSTNPKTSFINSLKSITLPTGGRIEYDFESNSIMQQNAAYDDICIYNTCYEYYDLDKIYTLDFDTNDPSLNGNLNFPNGYKPRVYVKYSYSLYPYPPSKPGVPDEIEYSLIQEDGAILAPNPFVDLTTGLPCPNIQYFEANLSQIKKVIVNGARQGYGKLEFYAVKNTRKHNNKFGYGLRIKSIKNYDAGSSTPAKWVKYEYNKFSDPLTSSGEIIEEDLTGDVLSLDDHVKPIKAVGYSNVKEINMLDNSYTKYTFYNSLDLYNFAGLNNNFVDFTTYLGRIGLLKKQEIYGTNNNILQETLLGHQSEIITLNNIKQNGLPIQKPFIKKETKTVKNYINGSNQALTTIVENNYESQFNNLIYSKETLYDGGVVEKNFQYAKEKNIQKLLDANLVGIPLETEIKNDGKVISKMETKLDNPSTLYPTSALTYNILNQNSSKKITFNSYDDQGNLTETKAENGVSSVTIWGYHKKHPIIKIAGANYAEVSILSSVTAAITASNADDDDPSNEVSLITALENVRKDDALKSYQIETYTYDPFIGITSKTGTNGLKESYLYDSSYRLLKILDSEGKTIKNYDYHYSSPIYSNDEMTDEYKSNNCMAGFLPNKYIYTVPANKYFSYINKDDANQKALQDITANGQNTANQIGGCTPLSCTITKGYDIAVLNSASLTMPDSTNFRLQMNFPYDSSLTWAVGKTVGKINGNCIAGITGPVSFTARTLNYGNWNITIYPTGNIVAKLITGSSSLPNGSIVNFDITFPINLY